MTTRTQKSLLPLVAVGGSLVGMPASALELGDMTVQSRLGQPLRASIAFALAQNERIADTCVSLGASASGLPGIGRATVSIGDGVILLTGKTPIREPMVAANVAIDCAYTPNLNREYMLFMDPPAPVVDVRPAATTAPAQAATAAPAVRNVNREPIGNATRYRVQLGDTLGDIAARIENRPIDLWPAANVIFETNPDAFINNDPNKLKAGSWLSIPSFDGSAAVVTEASSATSSATSEAHAINSNVSTEVATVETAATNAEATADLSPGDVILDRDNPFVDTGATTNENVVIPDTELQGPTTISSSPNVPTAAINTGGQESSTPWLMWLAGSGIVMIIGLLLFGRRFRDRNSAPPLATQSARRETAQDIDNSDAIAPTNYNLEDDSPTEENLTLDADLVVGTGLEQGTDMEVAQDFGFASPTEVDIELPFEPEAEVSSSRFGEETILESEILPDDEDYDLSVIIDATKMPQPEDITERDLRAIELTDEAESEDADAYTINREVDFNILQQDYEDELTATQALNVEIARAALELADDVDGATSEDETEEAPSLATVTELDVTVQMPPREEVIEELSDEDFLVETATVMMTEDATAEMPSADNDDSKDMDVDGGKVDTKAV